MTGRPSCAWYDINEKALNDVYEFCSMYNKQFPEKAITLTKTTDEDKALEGADYVIVAISHGGMEAEMEDHAIAAATAFTT